MHFDRNRLQTLSEAVSAETPLRKIQEKKKAKNNSGWYWISKENFDCEEINF